MHIRVPGEPGNEATYTTAHYCVWLFSVTILGNYMGLADRKGTQRGRLGA